MKSTVRKCILINLLIIIICFVMDAFDILAGFNIHLISKMNFGVWTLVAVISSVLTLYAIWKKNEQEKKESARKTAEYMIKILSEEYPRVVEGKADSSSVTSVFDALQPYLIAGRFTQKEIQDLIHVHVYVLKSNRMSEGEKESLKQMIQSVLNPRW